MVFIWYGLLRALQTASKQASDLSATSADLISEIALSWQQRVATITRFHGTSEVAAFLEHTATPALEAMAAQMRSTGFSPTLSRHDEHVELCIPHDERGVFRYGVRTRGFRVASFAWAQPRKVTERERLHYRAMAHSSHDDQPHDVTGYADEQLINDLLNRYARFRHARRMT